VDVVKVTSTYIRSACSLLYGTRRHHLKRHQTSDMGTIAGGGKHKEMIRSVGAHSYYSYSYNIEKHSIAGLSGG